MSDLPDLVLITDDNFEAEVLRAQGPVLVDFWAEWCGPCRMLGPTIEALATELGGRAKVGKCNVDENPRTAERFRIMSIPTVLIFRDGKVVRSLVGVRPKQEYALALAEAAA